LLGPFGDYWDQLEGAAEKNKVFFTPLTIPNLELN
jgi:hypothetical protein